MNVYEFNKFFQCDRANAREIRVGASMLQCLIVQPIHQIGHDLLRQAGIMPRLARSCDMTDVAGEIEDAAAVATRNAGLSTAAIMAARTLRVIAVQGIGVDPVDVTTATRRGIPVINTPYANVQSVAEHSVALLMALTKAIPAADRAARMQDATFRYRAALVELEGKTFGVVGFGRTGQATARLARRLGMHVIAYSPNRPHDVFENVGAVRASLDELVSSSDFISIHLPATVDTERLIGKEQIGRMKPGAYLINTGRASTIDEDALIEGLSSGLIGGAGLDVYSDAVIRNDHPLMRLENVILTPHIAGSTAEAMERAARTLANGIIAVLHDKKPDHLVNPQAWPDRWWAREKQT
jgi:D-3-phosphoglycerate dehydrogenase / 2-oxoglutarate reductase